MKTDETARRTTVQAVVDDEASTRERVARSILEHGPSTAAELGERLSLTPAAIRRHLGVLSEQGHVESREQRVYGARGRGRPAKVFLLTDSGRENFYQAYDELALQALRQLVRAVGPGAISTLAEQRVADVEAAYHRIRTEEPDLNPADALVRALNADGYVAYPDINVVEEMANMITAMRSYEASSSSVGTVKNMFNKALEIGR